LEPIGQVLQSRDRVSKPQDLVFNSLELTILLLIFMMNTSNKSVSKEYMVVRPNLPIVFSAFNVGKFCLTTTYNCSKLNSRKIVATTKNVFYIRTDYTMQYEKRQNREFNLVFPILLNLAF